MDTENSHCCRTASSEKKNWKTLKKMFILKKKFPLPSQEIVWQLKTKSRHGGMFNKHIKNLFRTVLYRMFLA